MAVVELPDYTIQCQNIRPVTNVHHSVTKHSETAWYLSIHPHSSLQARYLESCFYSCIQMYKNMTENPFC
jgi:membrane-bound lytic murein transglycosylase MltF